MEDAQPVRRAIVHFTHAHFTEHGVAIGVTVLAARPILGITEASGHDIAEAVARVAHVLGG